MLLEISGRIVLLYGGAGAWKLYRGPEEKLTARAGSSCASIQAVILPSKPF